MEGAEIASLRRRWLAKLIDAGVFLGPTVLVAGGAAALYMWYRRRSGSEGSEDGGAPDDPLHDRRLDAFRRLDESRRWRIALAAASLPLEVRLRNWRSPGMRALGLRRVDARTGGPVTVRSAVVREAVQLVWRELDRLAWRRSDKRRRRPWDSLGRRSLGSLIPHLPALWSGRKQGLTDRIAGIIVVRD